MAVFLQAWDSYQSKPKPKVKPAFRGFYKGGFADKMTKREAALILGVRYVRSRCMSCFLHHAVLFP